MQIFATSRLLALAGLRERKVQVLNALPVETWKSSFCELWLQIQSLVPLVHILWYREMQARPNWGSLPSQKLHSRFQTKPSLAAAALKMLPLRFHFKPSLAAAEMVAALIKCNLHQARDKSATWLLNTPFFIGKLIHFSF